MTSGWGLRCSGEDPGCRVPDALQGIDSGVIPCPLWCTDVTSCPALAVLHPAKFCVDAPSGKTSCNVRATTLFSSWLCQVLRILYHSTKADQYY